MSAPGGKAKILVAEDDQQLLDVLKSLFRSLEHRVKSANGPDSLVDTVTKENPHVLVCDLHKWQGLLRASTLPTALPPTLVIADYGELEEAKAAVASHPMAELLLKPVRAQVAIDLLNKLLQSQENLGFQEQETTPLPALGKAHFGLLVGEHPSMLSIYEDICKVAETDLTVLIRGESGTGKDLVARAIHQASPRASGPFVAVNCTSVHDNLLESELFGHVKGAFTGATQAKEGLFKAADGGTIFLDEIGSIPIAMQLSLLRVLQDRTFRPVGSTRTYAANVRVLAATNEDLEARIQQGLFREDLFFRLAAFPINLPPLRERLEDVPSIAQALLAKLAGSMGRNLSFQPKALQTLQGHDWPGNVRELQNVIQRAVATLPKEAQAIGPQDLKLPRSQGTGSHAVSQDSVQPQDFITLKAYLKQCERDYLKKVYDACDHDKEKTAKILGVSIGTFYRKLEE